MSELARFGRIRCPQCGYERWALYVPREFRCKGCGTKVHAFTATATLASSVMFAPLFFLVVAGLDQLFRRVYFAVIPYPLLALLALPLGVVVHLAIYPRLLRLEVRADAEER